MFVRDLQRETRKNHSPTHAYLINAVSLSNQIARLKVPSLREHQTHRDRSFITVTPVGCTLYCRIFVFYPFVKEFSPPLLNMFIRRARGMQRGNEVTRDRCQRYSVIYDTRNKEYIYIYIHIYIYIYT